MRGRGCEFVRRIIEEREREISRRIKRGGYEREEEAAMIV